MGCAASSAAPKGPEGAPTDWKAQIGAVFDLLDHNKTGVIALVAFKKREDKAGEISVLGEEVMKKQLEAGDLATKAASAADFGTLMEANAYEKGWPAAEAFLNAIKAAVGDHTDHKVGDIEGTARSVFKGIDSKWCQPADTGSFELATELKAMGDDTDKKAATICTGLEGKIEADAFVTHVLSKVPQTGWPRIKAELHAINLRLEKIADLDDMGDM